MIASCLEDGCYKRRHVYPSGASATRCHEHHLMRQRQRRHELREQAAVERVEQRFRRPHNQGLTANMRRVAEDNYIENHIEQPNQPPRPQPHFTERAQSPVRDYGEEKRITHASGGQKGQKAIRLGGADPLALLELGRIYGFGEEKYDRYNYLKGYDWSLSVDALLRHLLAYLSGEDRDPESGLLHTAHVAWHGLALTSFTIRGVGTDDRAPVPGQLQLLDV